MATNGVIKTFYEDLDTTIAVFPETTVEAIHNSEGKSLDDVYQQKLVSGSNIITINGASILNGGNINVTTADASILRQADVVDNLLSSLTNEPLSANQGRVLNEAISAMPSAMIFKGSLGTSGTITTLPTPSKGDSEGVGSTVGHTYQVITEGTYSGQAAKVGDLFVCNDTPVWVFLPTTTASGTVLNVATGAGLTGGPITTTGTIALANSGVVPGTYTKVTVDKYGRVTSEGVLTASDIPSLDTSKITSGTFADSMIASATTWNNKLDKNSTIAAATGTKITYDQKGLVTGSASLVEHDIPTLHLSKIDDVEATATEVNKLKGATITTTELNCLSGVTSGVQAQLNNKVDKLKDTPAAGTYTKLKVDASGLVTEGLSLEAADIPNLGAAKINSGVFDSARIPGLEASKIVSGTFADSMIASASTWNAKPDDLEDLGVTATATEINKLTGLTTNATQLNYVANVSSDIQDQIDAKQDELTVNPGSGTTNLTSLKINGVVYNVGAGSVSSVTAGTGLSGGTITTTGTISHKTSGVSAGTYSKVTVDTMGHVTAATDLSLSDLGITASKEEVNKLNGATISTTELNYLSGAGSNIQDQLDKKISKDQFAITGNVAIWTSEGSIEDSLTTPIYYGSGTSAATPFNADTLDNKHATDFIGNNYCELTLETTDWSVDTYNSEGCYSCEKTVTGCKATSHPMISCNISSIAKKDDERTAFGLIFLADSQTNAIKFYVSEVPATNFSVSVLGY